MWKVFNLRMLIYTKKVFQSKANLLLANRLSREGLELVPEPEPAEKESKLLVVKDFYNNLTDFNAKKSA